MVAPRAHQSGRTKSASRPSTVNENQKILRSIFWIVSLLDNGRFRFAIRKKLQFRATVSVGSGFRPELLHHTLNQLLGIGEVLHDQLHIHDRLPRPALALAI